MAKIYLLIPFAIDLEDVAVGDMDEVGELARGAKKVHAAPAAVPVVGEDEARDVPRAQGGGEVAPPVAPAVGAIAHEAERNAVGRVDVAPAPGGGIAQFGGLVRKCPSSKAEAPVGAVGERPRLVVPALVVGQRRRGLDGHHGHFDRLRGHAELVAGGENEGLGDAAVRQGRQVVQSAGLGRERVAARSGRAFQRQSRRRLARGRDRKRHRHARGRGKRPGVGAERRRGRRRQGHGHGDGLRGHANRIAGGEDKGLRRVAVRQGRQVVQRAGFGRERVAARGRRGFQRQHRRRHARGRDRKRRRHSRGRGERPRIRAEFGRGGGIHGHFDGLRGHAEFVAGGEDEGLGGAPVRRRRQVVQRAGFGRERVAVRGRCRFQRQDGRRLARGRHGEGHGHPRRRGQRSRIRPELGRLRGGQLVERQVLLRPVAVAGEPRRAGVVLQKPVRQGPVAGGEAADVFPPGERPDARRAVHLGHGMGGVGRAGIGDVAVGGLVEDRQAAMGRVGLDAPDDGRRGIRQRVGDRRDGHVREIAAGIGVGHGELAVAAGDHVIGLRQVRPVRDLHEGARSVVSPLRQLRSRQSRQDHPFLHARLPCHLVMCASLHRSARLASLKFLW
jgi:hypothetical protein